MVAVQDEVGLAHLVELDRRQVLAPMKRPVNALPPLSHARPSGQEGWVEVAPPPHAANDLLHLHNPSPQVGPVVGPERSSDVVEGEQPGRGRLSAQTGQHSSQKSPAPGAGQVAIYLLAEVHIWDHKMPFIRY